MPALERRLGLFAVTTISISSMIGSGIFVLPGIGFAITGPSLYLAFLISAICILPAAMSKAELATAMPTSGGTYVYLERTFGPLAGTVSGLGLFLSILLKASFSLIGIKAYFSVLSSFDPTYTAIAFLIIIVTLNIFGVGKVSSILTSILFVTLISLGILTLFAFPGLNLDNFTDLTPYGLSGLASATALVFVSFAGVTKVAAIAEEIKEPQKNLPRGILLSLLIVTVIYCLVSFILAGYYNYQEMAGELKPIYRLAYDIGGPTVGALFAIVATLTMVNTANAGILAGSRFPFAMSRDNLLPKFLGKLHPKFLTPIMSIFLSGAIIFVILALFDVTKIAKLASAFMILMYIFVNISVIVLRESRAQWYKPAYKAPLYPFLQIFGIVSSSLLLVFMGWISFYAIVSIAIPGVLLFIFYSKNMTTRKGVIGMRGKRMDLINQDSLVVADSFYKVDVEGDAEVVVSLFGREKSAEMLVEMAISLTEHDHVEVAHILEIPEQTDLHDMIDEPVEMKSVRRRIMAMANDKNESITYDPVMSHDVSKTVFDISQRLHCNWLVLEWVGKTRGTFTNQNPIGWLNAHLLCNLATFRDAGVRYIRKIMVLINKDKNDDLVMMTADHLAEVYKAQVTIVRFLSPKANDQERYSEDLFLNDIARKQKSETKVKFLDGVSLLKAVKKETAEHDLFILGSSDTTLVNSVMGTKDDKMISMASCSVLAVHAGAVQAQPVEKL